MKRRRLKHYSLANKLPILKYLNTTDILILIHVTRQCFIIWNFHLNFQELILQKNNHISLIDVYVHIPRHCCQGLSDIFVKIHFLVFLSISRYRGKIFSNIPKKFGSFSCKRCCQLVTMLLLLISKLINISPISIRKYLNLR